VLDRLRAFDTPAAFFLVGQRVASAPQLPEQIAATGHVVGNHTFSHRRFGWCDIASSLADVTRCQQLLPDAKWFRPPFGRLTPGLWLAARRLGLQCVNWSLDSGDWQCRSEADATACAAQVLELARPGDIVLFHDDHRWIGPILDLVLPGLADRGLLASPGAATMPASDLLSARTSGRPCSRPAYSTSPSR
jgi:peptidoglycan/xylan/chitin deacetylase (PgdA/CDA1 family)